MFIHVQNQIGCIDKLRHNTEWRASCVCVCVCVCVSVLLFRIDCMTYIYALWKF